MQKEGPSTGSDQFITLERDAPWKVQVAASGIIGAVLLLIGSFPLYMTFTHLEQDPLSKSWGVVLFGGAFSLVGLLMEYVFVHQSFASRVPETQVSICPNLLQPGSTAQLKIRQPGPVRLQSLNARLVCEIRELHVSNRPGESYYSSRYPHQERIYTSESQVIPSGSQEERIVTFRVPLDGEASKKSPDRQVIWRIEVWGRVRLWPDFMHPFTVGVSGEERQPAAVGTNNLRLEAKAAINSRQETASEFHEAVTEKNIVEERKPQGKPEKYDSSEVLNNWRVKELLGLLLAAPAIMALFYYKLSFLFDAPHHPTEPIVRIIMSIGLGAITTAGFGIFLDRILTRVAQRRSATEIVGEIAQEAAEEIGRAVIGSVIGSSGSSGSDSSDNVKGGGGGSGGGGASGNY